MDMASGCWAGGGLSFIQLWYATHCGERRWPCDQYRIDINDRVRQHAHARSARQRERLHTAGADVGKRTGHIDEDRVDAAAHEIDHAGGAAVVWYVHSVKTSDFSKQLHGEMLRPAGARGRVCNRRLLILRPCDEVFRSIDRRARLHDQ